MTNDGTTDAEDGFGGLGGNASAGRIDSFTARLLAALLADGRASTETLAADLDVTGPIVANYLADLEREGVIEGYVPRLDYDRLGYDVTAVFECTLAENAAPISEWLTDRRLVTVYSLTGRRDVLAVGKFRDLKTMNELHHRLQANPNVGAVTVDVALDAPREHVQFPPETASEFPK